MRKFTFTSPFSDAPRPLAQVWSEVSALRGLGLLIGMRPPFGPPSIGSVVLVGLVAQNTLVVLLMALARHKQDPAAPFLTSSVVLVTELAKLVLSGIFLLSEDPEDPQNVIDKVVKALRKPQVVFLALPSLVYLVQNNLTLLALGYLDAAVFQVMYQLKVVFAAFSASMMLGKPIDRVNRLAIGMLFVGVVFVAVSSSTSRGSASNSMTDSSSTDGPISGGDLADAVKRDRTKNMMIGLGATFAAAVLSSFAGTFTEKVFKSSERLGEIASSLWFKNFVMAGFSCIFGVIMIVQSDGPAIKARGFFQGFTPLVWLIILVQAVGGLLIGAVLKYTSNMAKTFATAISMVASSVASIFLFHFRPTLGFMLGSALVIVAVWLYSCPPPQRARVEEEMGVMEQKLQAFGRKHFDHPALQPIIERFQDEVDIIVSNFRMNFKQA